MGVSLVRDGLVAERPGARSDAPEQERQHDRDVEEHERPERDEERDRDSPAPDRAPAAIPYFGVGVPTPRLVAVVVRVVRPEVPLVERPAVS